MRRPLPAGAVLHRESGPDGEVVLLHDEQVTVRAVPVDLPEPVVPQTDPGQVRAAAERYPPRPHPSPECASSAGPAARTGPGSVPPCNPGARSSPPSGGRVATVPSPRGGLGGARLPGFWALDLRPPADAGHVVTASMSARLLAPVHPDRPYVVLGWPLGREGRKVGVASAIRDGGRLVAFAHQVLVTTDWGWPLPRTTRRSD